MALPRNWVWTLLASLGTSFPALGDPTDPLSLQIEEPTTSQAASVDPLRIVLEAGAAQLTPRTGSSRGGHRAVFDLRYAASMDEDWRWAFSNRLEDVHPSVPGGPGTTNSLRELYVGWQSGNEGPAVDFGRINHRQGPAYGYNPTDYFRAGALRTVTTVDPIALRETRLGTVMLRVTQLWDGGSAVLAVAPKLTNEGPSDRGASLDLGATNGTHRAMFSASQRFSERISAQASALFERGESPRLGINATALLTDALVVHGEVSSAKLPRWIDLARGVHPSPRHRAQQAALGATWTLPGALSVTLEAAHNGAGLGRAQANSLHNTDPATVQRTWAAMQRSQELIARRAWLLYVQKKGLGLRELDFSAFLRQNAVDHSKLGWIELRYHFDRLDIALQWQGTRGSPVSEFGAQPIRRLTQLVLSAYL